MAKIEKENFSHWEKEGKSREKQGSISSPLSSKNAITFCHFGSFLQEMGCGYTFNGWNQNLTFDYSWPTLFKKSLVPVLSSFVAIGTKEHFSKILNRIFNFGYFSHNHTHIFDKNELKYLMQN